MFTRQDYNKLIQFDNSSDPHVTIHIPTYRSGNGQEDRIRLKNAVSEAVDQLIDKELFPNTAMTKHEAQGYLSPIGSLLEKDDLWKNMSDGMVVFLNGEMMNFFTVPINFENFVFVGNQFYLRHLLPLLDKDNKFFVLALSQNEVRFFEGRENSITPVIIDDLVPRGVNDLIGAEDKERALQAHSGGANPIFHGQGAGKDDLDKELRKYFRDIDDGIMTMLHDETAPLLIYAVDYEIPIYKSVSKYSNISDAFITGNPEHDDPVLIHEKAWALMQDSFKSSKAKRIEEFDRFLAEDKASISTPMIIPAAYNGKVEKLYTDAKTEEIWGVFNRETNKVEIHEERNSNSTCMLNEVALATFNRGGTVQNIPRVDFPNMTSQLNAIYRY